MKNLILSILLVFVAKVGWNQYPIVQNIGSGSTLVRVPTPGGFQASLVNRNFSDTTSANLTPISAYSGAQIFTTSDTTLWIRNTGATKWVQMFGNTSGPSGDTLVWKLSGNTIGGRAATPVLGTLDGHDINFITDGTTRITLPSGGLARNMASTVKYLSFDTVTKQMYYGDGGGWGLTGNAGTTPGTDFIGTTDGQALAFRTNNTEWMRLSTLGKLGITTTSPSAKLHIVTDAIGSTQTDSTGINLENTTAGANGAPQYSPALVWRGQAWRNSGSVIHKWRAEAVQTNSTVTATTTNWTLSNSVAGGAYSARLQLNQLGNLSALSTTSGVYGSINGVPIGVYAGGLFIGTVVPTTITTASNNTFIGAGGPTGLTSGLRNTSLGAGAFAALTTADNNTAVGFNSMPLNTTGYSNAGFGMNTLFVNTTGFQNTAIGPGAMEANTTGQENTGVGYDALLLTTTGIRNTAIGWNARSGSDGGNNFMGGYRSGFSLLTGANFNTFLGNQTGDHASQKTDATNTMALGNNAYTTRNNQLSIGDSILSFTFRGVSRGVAGYALVDSLGNGEYWVARPVTTATPTWQQTLTAGSTLTGNNTINGGGGTNQLIFNNNYKFLAASGMGSFDVNDQNQWAKISYGNTQFILHQDSAIFSVANQDRMYIDADSFIVNRFNQPNSFIIEGITDTTLFVADAPDNRIGIGTNNPQSKLHTVGTVRHASLGTTSHDTTTYKPLGINSSGDIIPMNGWYGSGGGSNFANANLTLTANRSHDGGGFNVTLTNFVDITFETSKFYINDASLATALEGYVWTLVNESTGEGQWVAPSAGATPAGNYGNIQLNRNGAFATPASDSLEFDASGFIARTAAFDIGAASGAAGGKIYGNGGLGGIIIREGAGDATAIVVQAGRIQLSTTFNTRVDIQDAFTNVSNRLRTTQGADVASAAGAITLGSDGNVFEITGTAAITLISNSSWTNGSKVTLLFTSTATLTDGTANSGTDIGLELAGNTNFTASAGATICLILSEISGTQRWRETSRSVN